MASNEERIRAARARREASRAERIAAARGDAPSDSPQNTGSIARHAAQAGSGASEGLASVLGFPVDAVASAINGGAELAGADFRINDPLGGAKSFRTLFSPTMVDATDDPSEKFARGLGREVGAAVIPGGGAVRMGAKVPAVLATEAAAALGGQGAASTADALGAGEGVQEAARFAGNMVAGIPTAMAMSPGAKVPTTQELLRDGGNQIETAVSGGRTVAPAVTTPLSTNIRATLADKGLIRPSGKVQKGYTAARDVMGVLDDYASDSMTPEQVQAVRRQIGAASRQGGPEGRVGAQMLSEFDNNVTTPHLPDLAQGNAIYARGKRSEAVDLLIDRADRQASRSGTGGNTVNAIRQRADTLLRQIEDGKVHGYNAEEIAEIRKIVKGSRVTDALRLGGFAAPSTGKLQSAAAAGGAFATGLNPFLMGGLAASEASKQTAEYLSRKQIKNLSRLIRSGGASKQPNQSLRAIIAALTGGQLSQSLPQQ